MVSVPPLVGTCGATSSCKCSSSEISTTFPSSVSLSGDNSLLSISLMECHFPLLFCSSFVLIPLSAPLPPFASRALVNWSEPLEAFGVDLYARNTTLLSILMTRRGTFHGRCNLWDLSRSTAGQWSHTKSLCFMQATHPFTLRSYPFSVIYFPLLRSLKLRSMLTLTPNYSKAARHTYYNIYLALEQDYQT